MPGGGAKVWSLADAAPRTYKISPDNVPIWHAMYIAKRRVANARTSKIARESSVVADVNDSTDYHTAMISMSDVAAYTVITGLDSARSKLPGTVRATV